MLFDQAVAQATAFVFLNYAIFSIPLAAFLHFSLEFSPVLLITCLFIAACEQLMNMTYQLSLVNHRYLPFLYVSTAKSVLLMLLLVFSSIFSQLDLVLQAWSFALLGALLVIMLRRARDI